MIDMIRGPLHLAGLELSDFQFTVASAKYKSFGPFTPVAGTGGWYSITLPSQARNLINKYNTGAGLTQIRLRFVRDDNNNDVANYLSLYSGNATTSSRPSLTIDYYLP